MIRKITLVCALLTATFAFGQGRQRSVGSGGMNDAALMPMPVAGSTVSGAVTGISGNLIALAGGVVVVDATNAKITDEKGATGTIASITVGTSIFAVLSTNVTTNIPLPATMISVRRIAQVELTGPVSAIDAAAGTFAVLGRTIRVDANTSFGGRAKGLNDMLVNDIVSVSANSAGGTLLATSVMVMTPSPRPSVVIHGTVKSIGTDSWVITDKSGKDWTIVVNSQTKIVGDPKAGDTVDILANVDNANQYVAVSIMKSPIVVDVLVAFSGEVKSIGTTSWVIHDGRANKDVTVLIGPKTLITGNPQVNDAVSVTATADSAGNLTAVTIFKLGIVPPMTMTGVVKSIGPPLLLPCAAPPFPCLLNYWVIGPAVGMGPDMQIGVTSQTLIVGDPKVGDKVEVQAVMTGSLLYAVSIKKL